MPRHYTDEEKRLILSRLIANHGDVPRTAAECGINERNIYVWRKDSKFADMALLNLKNPTNFPNQSPSTRSGEGLGEGMNSEGQGVRADSLPPETTEAFQELHDQLLPIAKILANRIIEAIDEAPLNQRMTALSQLIDRIAKLAALLPEYEDDDPDEKPFEIDYDVKPKEDVDEEKEEEIETISPSAESASQPDQNPRKYSPF